MEERFTQIKRLLQTLCGIVMVLAPGWAATESQANRLYEESLKRYQAGDYSSATELSRRAIELDLRHAGAHHIQGLALAKARRFSEAELHLRQATFLAVDRADYNYDLGLILSEQRKYDEAIPPLRRAVALNSQHPGTRFLLGLMYVSRDRKTLVANFSQLALDQFRAVEEMQPKFPLIHYYIGKIHLTHGRASDALLEFRKELEFHPHHWQARRELAEVLLKLLQPEAALEQLQAGEREGGSSAGLLYLKAKALYELARTEEARKTVERAIEADPTLPDAYYLLGRLFQELNQPTKAREALEKFSRLTSSSSQPRALREE